MTEQPSLTNSQKVEEVRGQMDDLKVKQSSSGDSDASKKRSHEEMEIIDKKVMPEKKDKINKRKKKASEKPKPAPVETHSSIY